MKTYTKQRVAWVAAVALLITCALSGLVLPAAAEPTVQLFPNGDFEGFAESTPVTVPWNHVTANGDQKAVAQVTAGAGVDGSWGLVMGSTVGTMYVDFDGAVQLEEGATYRLSWMATSGAAKESVGVSLNSAPNTTLVHSSAKVVKSKRAPVAGEWIAYYIDFKASAGAYIHDNGGIIINRYTADSATIAFDNFSLTKIDETADVVLNSDFEKAVDASFYSADLGGTYALLSNDTKAAVVQEAADNRALLLKQSGSGWTGGYFNASHFVGGESYKVSFRYKGGSFRFYANPNAHGSFNDNKASVMNFAAADEWTTGEFTFNFLTNGSNNWAFCFEKNSGNHTADTYVDDFKIVKATAPAATGITLDKTEATVKVGESVTLTVDVQPTGAVLPAIAWTTSDVAVATVTNGKVTAVAEGTATVTATAAGLPSVSCAVTVIDPVEATAITLNRTTVAMEVGGTVTLAVGTLPENADMPTVTWATSNASVAAVANGKVKALAEGTATITASAAGLPSVSCEVTVSAAGLLVNGSFEQDATDGWGGSAMIVAGAGKDGSYGLKIESTLTEGENSKTPGVYYKGAFNEILEENTVYRLTFEYKHEGKGEPQFDAVYGGTDWIGFKDTKLEANADWKTATLEFTTGMAANMNIHKGWEWQVRIVHHANAENYGTGVLYADNFKLEKVRAVAFAESLSIIPQQVELLPYGSQTLQVGVQPVGTAKGTLTWSVSDASVLSIDGNGVVTALVKSGTATVTVKNQFNKTATATVTISENANQFQNGDFEQGGANWNDIVEIKPGIGKDGSYGLELRHSEGSSSSNSRYYKKALNLEPATTYEFSVDYLATKGSSFRFWSYGFGLKNPVIEAGDGTVWKTASVIFTTPTDMKLNAGWDFGVVCDAEGTTPAVIDNLVLRKYSSGIAPDSITLSLQDVLLVPGRTEAITAHATPPTADLNDMRWTSSDENVATVEYGVVMGVGSGTAVITAITKNGKTATCTVTVNGDEALVKNGSFDIENDASWTLENGAVIVAGEGRADSAAVQLTAGASLSQAVTGLKSRTTYQLHVRFRSASGTANIKLTNGSSTLLNKDTTAGNYWQSATYEFRTGWSAPRNAVLTISTEAAGPIYVDAIVLAEKASLVDLEASSVVWSVDEQVKPGTEMTFAVSVTNRGTDRVQVGEAFTVDICVDGVVVQTLGFVCTDNKQLTQNETVLLEGDEIWTATEGDHVISARVNLNQNILEMNVNNNTCQAYLRVSNDIFEAPQVAQDAGMTNLTFSDEFNSVDSIDRYATGKDGYKWYVNRQWSASTITPNDYTVKDGVLTLHAHEPTYNIALTTMDGKTGVGYSYRMGYLEVKLRIPKPDYDHTAAGATGGIPAVWSFPENKWLEVKGENTQWVEIDWLEYWGKDTAKWPQYPDGYYTVTLHDQIQGKDGKNDRWYSNGNAYQNGLGDGEWHTMGWLWANDLVITYVDGVEVMRLTYDLEGYPNVSTRVHEGVLEEGAFSFMNYQYAVLYLGGAVDNPMEVDYVHIWQGGDGVVDIPEDTEPEVIVDIAANKFWYNYCTDDWGDPIYELTAANKHNVLNGEILWSKLSDERRTEINALLKENGQQDYETLLAEAKKLSQPQQEKPPAEKPEEKPDEPPTPPAEQQPVTGERAPALPWILGGLMLLCIATAVFAVKRKK
ncbi:MAG: Ig-like domain-containing protein [Clostridia bacterium]|nr:Ig-like domain-containing protein [Clostridia bacterium]